VFDVGAYLERIGLGGRPGLTQMHRAHVHAIPFENLDPHAGHHVSLATEELERKIVQSRRGGYCFEHNLLFKAACEALGAEVDAYLARVRWHAPAGAVRPRTHLVLGVHDGGTTWHADVGFGAGTPLEPIPFGPGGPYEQSGWTFRVVEDGAELVLQRLDGDDWGDVYAFSRTPSPMVDIEVSNWFVSTHPDSPFVRGVIVSRRPEDGSIEMLSDWSGELVLLTETPEGSTSAPVARDELPELIASHFGLPTAPKPRM
jgi:N-hydroxyarylamine O-acetyltransferase